MRCSAENEFLKIEADSQGAQLCSVVDKASGAQMLWQADSAVWDRCAPILFPYCGKLKDGRFEAKGRVFHGGQHGFGRDMEHEFLGGGPGALRFALASGEATRALFPFEFRLVSEFLLDGRTVRHRLTVENPGGETLRFGLGYHPGFALPFDSAHTTADYELRFDAPQTPVVYETPEGLVSGETHLLMENSPVIPLDDRMFDEDSICMGRLTAGTLSLVEKDTGRRVTVDIEKFPYTLIWSKPGDPALRFLCIEPWLSLPDRADASGRWQDKPCAAALAPGGRFTAELAMTFDR